MVLVSVLLVLGAASARAQDTTDDAAAAAFRRAQRLVNDGQGAEGRALVDSMLNAAELRSSAEAEALYWRATLAESWESAQRDYLRIMLEHERSPRAGDAMLRLAQGEAARGDRDAALRYLERLAREAPESPARAEAGLWQGRLLLETGSRDAGCRALFGTRGLVPAGSIELENQYAYLMRACPDPGAIAPPSPAPAAAPVAPEPSRTAVPTREPAGEARAASGASWSFQVAALSTEAEANALVVTLRDRGYDARVDGSVSPFRVRVGRYTTRAAAATAADAYKAKERAAAFVVEVPRG